MPQHIHSGTWPGGAPAPLEEQFTPASGFFHVPAIMINLDRLPVPEPERPKMSVRAYTTISLILLAAAPAAYAQSADSRPAPRDSAVPCVGRRMADSGMHQMGMRQMGAMHRMDLMAGMRDMPMPSAADNARLDSLVIAMHQSRGDKKLAAMEKVIDELLAHRKMMQEHMQRMMRAGMESGGPGMSRSAPADSTNRSQQH
jgi:hypothetical protein